MGLRCLAVAAEEVGLGGSRVGGSEGVGSVVLHQFVGDNIITVKLSIIRNYLCFFLLISSKRFILALLSPKICP